MISNVVAGETIPPEFIRIVLAGCLKVASLKAVVYTIPSKSSGLRIQTTDIVLGEPGVGKGQAFQWRDNLMEDVKKMFLKAADDEYQASLVQPPPQRPRLKFKYYDGVERFSDSKLPFLVDLPNGSSEAVFLLASKNAGCGLVPVLE